MNEKISDLTAAIIWPSHASLCQGVVLAYIASYKVFTDDIIDISTHVIKLGLCSDPKRGIGRKD